MINFEEELKKFHESLELEQAQDVIQNEDLYDVSDVLVAMLRDQTSSGAEPAPRKARR